MNQDPIGFAGSLNLFGYAGQNPVGWVDPSGLVPNALNVWVEGWDGAGLNALQSNLRSQFGPDVAVNVLTKPSGGYKPGIDGNTFNAGFKISDGKAHWDGYGWTPDVEGTGVKGEFSSIYRKRIQREWSEKGATACPGVSQEDAVRRFIIATIEHELAHQLTGLGHIDQWSRSVAGSQSQAQGGGFKDPPLKLPKYILNPANWRPNNAQTSPGPGTWSPADSGD